ncbi:transposase [Halalkalibacter alkalisediminis]|uniref:Transposase n=1 Tax=Halalkalibacter alkalisediminis TaxID=935616 RepID=A0ABV6NHT2_9BACI|nr:transposase [Halalkalibacter alkalisediminis]
MNFWIGCAVLIVPIVMFFVQKVWERARFLFSLVAFTATVIFGSISANAIYFILETNEVFMTTIHGIFLNRFFLITGAYLGWYILYQLLLIIMKDRKEVVGVKGK